MCMCVCVCVCIHACACVCGLLGEIFLGGGGMGGEGGGAMSKFLAGAGLCNFFYQVGRNN